MLFSLLYLNNFFLILYKTVFKESRFIPPYFLFVCYLYYFYTLKFLLDSHQQPQNQGHLWELQPPPLQLPHYQYGHQAKLLLSHQSNIISDRHWLYIRKTLLAHRHSYIIKPMISCINNTFRSHHNIISNDYRSM